MNKDEYRDFANNPKYISGIYNYCDRWCERCSFTARCLNYEFGEKHFDDPESRDLNNKMFWDKLSEVFQLTMEMLQEDAEELGIDLNDPGIEDETINIDKREDSIENINLVNKAKEYSDLAHKWFECHEEALIEKRDQLIPQGNIDLSTPAALDTALKIDDAVEIIRWYQFQIFVKLKRAYFSKMDEEDEFDEDYPKDSDGSAKVALIGIDRSIAAWGKFYVHFDSGEDDILNMLLLLTGLKEGIELEFPNARSFVRVGFDD